MGGSYSKYDVDAALENAYDMLNSHAEGLNKLSSWREEVDNKIKGVDIRISLGNNTQSTGSSADVQSLLKNVDAVNAESERLRADIKALSTLIDQNTAEIGHWKGEVEALPAKFRGILGAEVNTMNAKYRALSTRVENGFNNSPPAINRGLAIGLPLGFGIPLTIAVIFLCAMWIRRRHPYIPQHMNNEEAENYIKIHNATRRKTLTEKLCDLFEALGFKKIQGIPEVYVMEHTPTK
ncbi:hypothetical protein PENFLA_c040G00929 [Penicillium flavigenum]|uniref:Uncharacterized protein n=1 Tax=Penicillium flavigenum TaxID=254877 RepID=A0A1V6SJJ9_9EURO|nr:hypothetical protein PENFLA_c040G00929 [Penicillium flavigenum]